MLFVKRVLILVLLSAGWFLSPAQTSLRITQLGATPTGNVNLGTSFSFDVAIENNDTSTFNGSIGLLYSINGTPQPMDTASGLSYDTSFTIVNLPPFDTTRRSITVKVTNPRFQTGPSVVVIWPIASNAVAEDSVVLSFNVIPAVSIPPIDSYPVKAFVSNGNIVIEADSVIVIKQVRVFDIMGREVMDKLNPMRTVPLPETNHGIYVAEITYNNNKRKTIRFFR